jgi:hypothetical protein
MAAAKVASRIGTRMGGPPERAAAVHMRADDQESAAEGVVEVSKKIPTSGVRE